MATYRVLVTPNTSIDLNDKGEPTFIIQAQLICGIEELQKLLKTVDQETGEVVLSLQDTNVTSA
jgi:hypothetical protein